MLTDTAEYQIINGTAPFLISAPHSYGHKRPRLNCTYKLAEPFTDVICQQICKETQSTGIYLSKDCEYDPNFFNLENNQYKKEVRDICKKEKKKIFLDFHGLNEKHEYDIGIYYLSRFSKSNRIAKEIRDILDNGELKGLNIQILRFPENDQETLSEFVASKLKIPALQIEIARYIREDEELRETLVKSISNYLNSY